jgi:hypothetical protein
VGQPAGLTFSRIEPGSTAGTVLAGPAGPHFLSARSTAIAGWWEALLGIDDDLFQLKLSCCLARVVDASLKVGEKRTTSIQ